MTTDVPVCNLDDDLKAEIKKFRFSRCTKNRALVMKIDQESMTVVADGDVLEDVSVDELREELPEHLPRYVIYSFKLEHSDGRVSFPLCFIFLTPRDCKTETMFMYAGSKLALVKEAEIAKVYELRELEEFTDEWLEEKLKK